MEVVKSNERATALSADLAGQPVIGLDIETAPASGFEGDTRAGLCPYRSRVRLVSVATQSGDSFVFDMEKVAPAALAPLADAPWVCHNSVFEYRHMKHHGYPVSNRLHDTQLMGRPLHNEILSLSNLSKAVTGNGLDKSLQVSDWTGELSPSQLEYAALDSVVALDLANQLLPKLNSHQYGNLYRLYQGAIPVIAQQELDGVHIDWQKHRLLYEKWLIERDQLQIQLDQLLGTVNPRSSKQLSQWLLDNLPSKAAERWPRTDTGNLSTSGNTLALHADLPMVQPLLRHKACSKLISAYGKGYERFKNPVTGRLHSDFIIAGTAGGRFACRNPNIQNPPRDEEFRSLFCAESGRVLVAADYSQIELRVAALLSQDKRMLQAYTEGQDLHRVTAAAISGVDISQITPSQRQAAKAVNFGNLYRQRPAGLARYARSSYGVDMSVKQAGDAQDRFFQAYPQLHQWQLGQVQKAHIYRKVRTVTGLIRDFNFRSGYEAAEACNHPIQGSAGEVLLAALVQLPEQLSHVDARLVNHVHDEIILSVAVGDEAPAANALEQAMVQGFLAVFPNGEALLPELVDVKIGASWAETK